jgi:hypothetical protein
MRTAPSPPDPDQGGSTRGLAQAAALVGLGRRRSDSPQEVVLADVRMPFRGRSPASQEWRLPEPSELSLRELRPRLDIEFPKSLRQVILDRTGTDKELSSDLSVGISFGSEAGDL